MSTLFHGYSTDPLKAVSGHGLVPYPRAILKFHHPRGLEFSKDRISLLSIQILLLQSSMDILGFEEEQKLNIYKIVAAVMHLGTMKFKQRGREEQAEADGTKVLLTPSK